ncbi:MAG: porin [Bacteroidota bacterium]|nr:porin [Bacteroidota bacterium]
MKHSKIKVFLVATLLSISTSAFAQDSTKAAPITYSGFVDFYYSKNLGSPLSLTNKLRNFDIQDNQFTMSLAELVIQKAASPVGFRLDLDYGETNDIVHGLSPYGTTPYKTSTIAQQAYLTAVLPIGSGLTLDAGKFVTHMGYEVIESKDNANYTRSLLFAWAIPYYHTGIRLTYPVASNFTATLHIVNGWNTVIDNNSKKSIGLTLNYAASSSTGLIFNYMTGFEQPQGANGGKKNVFDFILTENISDNLSLALNADYGEERVLVGSPLAMWKGAALYVKYALSEKSALALRAEGFYDPLGYATGLGLNKETIKEATLTYEHKVFDAFIVRVEGRGDFANASIFEDNGGLITKDSQLTALIGLIATF